MFGKKRKLIDLYDNVRPINNLKEMIEDNSKIFANLTAFSVKDKNGKIYQISHKVFKQEIDNFGTSLLKLGLKGKPIAIIGENKYQWCLSYLAVINGVGIAVPIDKELGANEIEAIIKTSSAEAVIFSEKYQKTILEISKNLTSVKVLINMDTENSINTVYSLKELTKSGEKLIQNGFTEFIDLSIDAEKLSVLIFTSGTTDNPKAIMLSHKNILSNIKAVCQTCLVTPKDSHLSILPLHHTYECTLGFLATLYTGASISFIDGLRYIAKNMTEYKPTYLVTVPLILENLHKKIWDKAKQKKLLKFKLKSALFISNFIFNISKIDIRRILFKEIHENLGGRVKLIITGAAAIEPKVIKFFRQIGINVLQGYGLSECSPLVTGNRDKIHKNSSVGLPIPGVEIKLLNVNDNGIGEIAVKGPNVMLGYYNNEQLTREVFQDGWLKTGDMGYIDKTGFLYITGRIKNVIITKNGKNIFPEQIEQYILKSPYVKEAVVLGIDDSVTGDVVVGAHIFPDIEAIKEKFASMSPSPEEIQKIINNVIKSVNKNIPNYMHIKQFTLRNSEFIKTTTQKIKRHMIKQTETC